MNNIKTKKEKTFTWIFVILRVGTESKWFVRYRASAVPPSVNYLDCLLDSNSID